MKNVGVDESCLSYPVLRINDSHIRRFRSCRELRKMSQNYFDAGEFKRKSFLIDSDGRRYDILDVVRLRRSWNPLIQLFRPSPAIVVRVDLSKPIKLSLDDIKRLVLDPIEKNKWFRQGGETGSEFRATFDKVQSVRDLIDGISFYGRWQG